MPDPLAGPPPMTAIGIEYRAVGADSSCDIAKPKSHESLDRMRAWWRAPNEAIVPNGANAPGDPAATAGGRGGAPPAPHGDGRAFCRILYPQGRRRAWPYRRPRRPCGCKGGGRSRFAVGRFRL